MDDNTPTTDVVSKYCQKTTLIKVRIQGAVNFLEKKGIRVLNKDIFCANCVFYATGYKILKFSNFDALINDPTRKDIRKKKKVIMLEQIKQREIILENDYLEGRKLIWEQLGIKLQ